MGSLPVPQIESPGAHNSRVLGLYRGPMAIGGAPYCPSHWSEGVPKSVTAATWFAISGDIGFGTAAAGTPGGTAAEVTKPATAAPWEYPPSTSRVLGQFAAMDWM